MTLEFEKFDLCAQEFLALSTSFGDQWVMKIIDSNQKDLYLEKRATVLISSDQSSGNVGENVVGPLENFATFVYHIIYSQSYSVPVLYFNAYHADGKLLSLDEIWNRIPSCYQNCIENKWQTITQQEHPKLGIPYFTIHPCYTSDFMSVCNTSNYIITWLSIVGPLVGLHLSSEYAKHAICNEVK